MAVNLLSKNSTNNNNLYFIPHFNGRTFPLDDNLTGAFLGISQTKKKGDMFKAIMESIAFEYKNYFNGAEQPKDYDELDKMIHSLSEASIKLLSIRSLDAPYTHIVIQKPPLP